MSVKTGTAQGPNGNERRPFYVEILGLFLFAGSLFTAASIISYSPSDPSLTHYALGGSRNWMGPVGANLSAFVLEVLGFASWWIPFLLAAMGWSLVGSPDRRDISLAWMFSGWTAMLLSTSTALALLTAAGHANRGGLIGIALSGFLNRWCGVGGAVLVVAVFFLAGLIAATPFSLASTLAAIPSLRRRILSIRRASSKEAEKAEVRPAEVPSADSKAEPKIPKIIEVRRQQAAPDQPREEQEFQVTPPKGDFKLPPVSFLEEPPEYSAEQDKGVYLANAHALEQKLLDFGVAGSVVEICPGPVVTMYEFSPAPGVKINKVAVLADDLALALKTHSVRIVAPIPGKAVIGIELANANRQIVYLKEVLASKAFSTNAHRLPLALGQDIVGEPVVADLARMPHLLIAGATGTGKSVGLNAMICSLLYCHNPDTLRLLMIDPKRIELSLYDGIPHLLHTVVSEPKEATRALKWAVMEMERRYQMLEEAHARNIDGYNKTAEEPLPFLVVVIDELADLMMVSSKEVESAIARLAQMARAAGIHLLVATQRPSVDVLTGLIKANFPARISFKVSSKVDSRTILDVMGAERLLGMGDMLFLPPGKAALERIHGPYVSEKEIGRIVEFLKAQGEPQYDPTVVEPIPGEEDQDAEAGEGEGSVDARYDEAVEIVTQSDQASISMLQRRLRVGYNRAARMIEQMEREGVVSPTDAMGRRQVLARKYD